MVCFVVAGFVLKSALCGPSAIAELLVGVVGSLVIVLLQIFSWFWQWNNFENYLIFDKVKVYNKFKPSFGPPCIWFPISLPFWLCFYLALFPRYYRLFPKIWRRHVLMTTPTQETICNPSAKLSHGEPYCTKFEVSSFSHSGNILGGLRI